MSYSDKLNGYWEEGYHYYLEFRDDKLTVRDYRRSVTIETTVSYDADALERGERTVIHLADNILSYTGDGEMMSEIKELAYENGELQFLYYYTIMGETLYTLKKVDHHPFAHIIIRDDEFLEKLQGEWLEWPNNEHCSPMNIKGSALSWRGMGGRFHVVTYTYSPDEVHLVPENLIDTQFSGITSVLVEPDMLITRQIIMDMDMPTTVFARAEMIDKIEVPDSARQVPRNTMMYHPTPFPNLTGMPIGMMRIPPTETRSEPLEKPAAIDENDPMVCKSCGYRFSEKPGRFCPECGSSMKE